MSWLILAGVGIGLVSLYAAMLNQQFLRCPYCRKIGAWRFDNVGEPLDEFDAEKTPKTSDVSDYRKFKKPFDLTPDIFSDLS